MTLFDLHKQIKIKRKSLGMSQRRLAQKCGVSPSAICQIEKMRKLPKLSLLKKMAKALKTTPNDLLCWK